MTQPNDLSASKGNQYVFTRAEWDDVVTQAGNLHDKLMAAEGDWDQESYEIIQCLVKRKQEQLAIAKPVPQPDQTGPHLVCKGSLALGSGCGQCQRCCNELANVIAKLRDELSSLRSNVATAVESLEELGLPVRERYGHWSAWQYKVKLHRDILALLRPPLKKAQEDER
jgi:hypothetical protein